MPIPFLLAGLGVAAGVIGAGGHISAKDTNERAQKISQEAQKLYNNAKYSLELAKRETEKSLVKLGYSKKNVLDTSMSQFITTYDKIKHIQIRETVGINEISKFKIDQHGVIQIQEMTNIYSSSFASSATGVATGAAVALAASGALPIVTGELAIAGSALAAGQVGAAASIAGSALSFGAAMTPLAAVAAPVVLFTGISASIKADENLEKANTMYAEAEAAVEKMKISETLCLAISERSNMFDELLLDLDKMFAECSALLAGVIRKKEGRVFKKKLTSNDFTEEDLKLIAVTRALAGAVKAVIDTPILSKEGNVSYESEDIYNQTVEKIPDFSQVVQEVKIQNREVKPVIVKAKNVQSDSKSKVKTRSSVMGGARSVFAILIGIIIASFFAENIATSISIDKNKFLFMTSQVANEIAIWLFLCANVTILIGKFRDTNVEILCGWGTGISLFILYVQYCRTVEQMEHYIIFSIIFLLVSEIVYGFFVLTKNKWSFAKFFSTEAIVIMVWPMFFLIYAFFCKFLWFSEVFCLVVTSVLMFILSVFGMPGMLEDS